LNHLNINILIWFLFCTVNL